jgi:hypothetical protein
MNGYTNSLATGAGQDLGQRAMNPINPPSLEDRLQRLAHGCERLSRLRARLSGNVERVQPQPPKPATPENRVRPESSALSERFGEAIAYVHDSCDELEFLCMRLEDLLFASEKAAPSPCVSR